MLPNDFVTLDPGLRYIDTAIVDEIIGVHHMLHRSSSRVMRALVRGVPYQNLYSLDHRLADIQVRDLLGFLNILGGLHVRRSRQSSLRALRDVIRHMLFGIIYVPLAKRYTDTFTSVSLAAMRACKRVFIASGIVTALACTAGFSTSTALPLLYGVGVGIFGASVIIHEWAHVLCVRFAGMRAVILQRGSHIQVLHRQLDRKTEIISACIGPLAGASIAIAAGVVAFACNRPSVSSIAGLIAITHLLSLLPWYADGKSLLRALSLFSKREIIP